MISNNSGKKGRMDVLPIKIRTRDFNESAIITESATL